MTSFEPDGDDSLRLAKDTVSTTILQKQEVKYRIQGHHTRKRQRPKLLFPSSICAWLHFSLCGLQELKMVAIAFSQQNKENLAGDAEDFFIQTLSHKFH